MQGERQQGISKAKFKEHVNNWGINMTEEQLDSSFNKIDLDRDGLVTQREFQEVLGPLCFPDEGFFFR